MYYFKKRKGLKYRNPYWDIAEYLNDRVQVKDTDSVLETIRAYSLTDLYFLTYFALNRTDIHDERLSDGAASWLMDRCYEVQDDWKDVMHIWARYHYKTTFNTTSLIIQQILNNPNETHVLLSYTHEIATKFMLEIKDILERNTLLKLAFPDVLYMNPKKESKKWSEDKGIAVKRDTTRRERTVEAYGIDSLPTGAHFDHRIYNDVVTVESTYTPERIAKTKERFQNSHALKDRHGDMRIEGTIYHFNDLYCEEIEKGNYKLRFHPAEDESGNPNFLTRDELDKEKSNMGPRVYACHAGGTRVMMSNWEEKFIEDIKVGDEVIGFVLKDNNIRLKKTKILAVQSRLAETNEVILENGDSVICTPDHKWWTGRSGNDTHRKYNKLGTGCQDLNGLIPMGLYDTGNLESNFGLGNTKGIKLASWLGGIFDGEGSISGGSIHIHQSESHNPEVCKAIREALEYLDFDYGEVSKYREGHGQGVDFYLKGGRAERLRFAKWCNPIRKQKILDSMYICNNGNYRNRIKLESIIPAGIRTVYNIQTETGNYIANGYASKNCQMLLNPASADQRFFEIEWLEFHKELPEKMNKYILCDPASKTKAGHDFTVIECIGASPERKLHLVDMVRDKLNQEERWKALRDMVLKHPETKIVGYESYSKDAEIEFMYTRMREEGIYFNIEPLSGNIPKDARIEMLVPLFYNRQIILPLSLKYHSKWDNKTYDLIDAFIKEEYSQAPFSTHDDMIDCMSRICDPKIWKNIVYPKSNYIKEEVLEMPTPNIFPKRRRNSMSWMGR